MAQDENGSMPGIAPADFPFDEEAADVFASVDLEVPIDEVGAAPVGATTVETHLPHVALTVHPPRAEARRLEVDQRRFLLGRPGETDLQLDDPFVSRWHAQIFVDPQGTVVLQDLGSDNGVFLRIADEFALEDGDEIVAGQQHFIFRSNWDANDQRGDGGRDEGSLEEGPRDLGAPVAGSPVRLERYFEGGVLAELHPISDRLTIGSEGADVECPEDFDLSAQHAEIVRDGDTLFLRDLDSDYGTFIRIQNSVELVDGDRFVIGRTHIDVECA